MHLSYNSDLLFKWVVELHRKIGGQLIKVEHIIGAGKKFASPANVSKTAYLLFRFSSNKFLNHLVAERRWV